MNELGYKNVFRANSFWGIYYSLRAKYAFTDFSIKEAQNPIFFEGATTINLWHGIPLKKIAYDIDDNFNSLSKVLQNIYLFLKPSEKFYVVNNEYEKSCYITAFRLKENQIKTLGSPRLDVLFRDFENSDIFMENDVKNIEKLKKQGKKLFLYMPTYRDTGKDISGWLNSDELKTFLKQNNAVLICKLHHSDKNSLTLKESEEFYKMNENSDIYAILKYSDALITDYSSVNFDYLLLDKPIIYFVPDLDEYQKKCRAFYMDFGEFAVGEKNENHKQLFNAMLNVIQDIDNYKNERKTLKDKMFKYQDGKNSERVFEFIKSLDV